VGGLENADIWILTILAITVVGLLLVALGVWMVWKLYLLGLSTRHRGKQSSSGGWYRESSAAEQQPSNKDDNSK
jgi:hypothetical protein